MNIFSDSTVIGIGMIVLVGHMIGCSEQMIGNILAAVVLLRFLLCMLLPRAVLFYWKCHFAGVTLFYHTACTPQ